MSDFTRRRRVPRGLILTDIATEVQFIANGTVATSDLNQATYIPSGRYIGFRGYIDARATAPPSPTTPTISGLNNSGGMRVWTWGWEFVAP